MIPSKIKLKQAVGEIKNALEYPLEYRIAKFILEAGYTAFNDGKESVLDLIREIDPKMDLILINKIYSCMWDIERSNKGDKFYYENIPNLK